MVSLIEREWAILIYANGNNELAPEIIEGLLNLKGLNVSSLHLAVQLSYSYGRMMDLFRPSKKKKACSYGEGMVRYSICSSKKGLTKHFLHQGPVVNMANSHELYDFIAWGMRTFPAKRYILILSGHGAGFLGVLADYSADSPLLMPIPALARALKKVATNLPHDLSLVILDLCFMNSIEVLYELAFHGSMKQRLLLFPIEAPLQGLSYERAFQFIHEKGALFLENSKLFFQGLAKKLNDREELILMELKEGALESIKAFYNQVTKEKGAQSLLTAHKETLAELNRGINRRCREMILYPKEKRDYFTFFVPQSITEYLSYREYYQLLAFAKRNERKLEEGPLFHRIPKRMMINNIQLFRPDLHEKEIEERLDEMGWYS